MDTVRSSLPTEPRRKKSYTTPDLHRIGSLEKVTMSGISGPRENPLISTRVRTTGLPGS